MDSQTVTHVVAILVGVLVTLAVVTGFASSKPSATDGSSSSATGSSGKGPKKKPKKKKAKGGGGGETGPNSSSEEKPKEEATRFADAPPLKDEEEKVDDAKSSDGGKKKKKKAVKKPASEKDSNPPANGNSNSSKKENQPKAANTIVAPVTTLEEPVFSEWQAPPSNDDEEWNDVVESKKKKKIRPERPKPAAATEAAAASATTTSDSVTVDAKKIGIIIGPKGATMQAIQAATGCQLDINAPAKDDKEQPVNPKATIAISGPDKDSCNKAKTAITDLATKGYAKILQGDEFGEYSIEVHPRYLSEIVGPGGKTIQALQTGLQVKLTIPSTDWKPNAVQVGKVKMCKVGIAGCKENSKACKEAIKSLMKYHHHEITHPGVIHEEVYVPQEFFHCVIGPRGSEIKHIRGNYKVDIYMPNAESETENVTVVGKQFNVDKAISYIQLLMDRDTEQREKKYSDDYYD